mmetsp:Transcript_31759/g.62896  ORF Transcript_31759/g.62896 Transcript_31759/m.62896 type:complete len:118 (+) Transcript_31759:848-1201(+)
MNALIQFDAGEWNDHKDRQADRKVTVERQTCTSKQVNKQTKDQKGNLQSKDSNFPSEQLLSPLPSFTEQTPTPHLSSHNLCNPDAWIDQKNDRPVGRSSRFFSAKRQTDRPRDTKKE